MISPIKALMLANLKPDRRQLILDKAGQEGYLVIRDPEQIDHDFMKLMEHSKDPDFDTALERFLDGVKVPKGGTA